MPSLVTSIIGGIQGSSAAKNAGNASAGGYNNAATTIGTAIGNANSTIGTGATNANAGIAGAVTGAQTGVNTATGTANTELDPYVTNGSTAASALSTMLGPGGSMTTTPTAAEVMQNDPGFQFQLQQGQQAIQRAAAANGAVQGGGTAKALGNYTLGAAQSGYQQAFEDTLQQQAQQFGELNSVSNEGETAANQEGQNTIGGAVYGGNVGLSGATTEGANTLNSALAEGGNTMQGNEVIGQDQIGAGNAIAAGDIGSANAWNGMLNSIGSAGNSFLTGGFGGGGGFSLGGALSGMPQYPSYSPNIFGSGSGVPELPAGWGF